MKKNIILLLILLNIGCVGSKETTGINDSTVPTHTNVIEVYTNLEAESGYRHTAQILQNRGYTFRSSDETLKSISTDFRGVSQRWGVDNTFVRIGSNIRGDKNVIIVLRGWYKTLENEDTETGQSIRKFGQNGSPMRNAWKELFQVANSLGDSLSFKQQ